MPVRHNLTRSNTIPNPARVNKSQQDQRVFITRPTLVGKQTMTGLNIMRKNWDQKRIANKLQKYLDSHKVLINYFHF